MTVVCFKLANGEEIIAQGTQAGNTWHVEKVRGMGVQQAGKGQVQLVMGVWMIGDHNAKIELNPAQVIAWYHPLPHIEKAYLTEVSGLDLSMMSAP